MKLESHVRINILNHVVEGMKYLDEKIMTVSCLCLKTVRLNGVKRACIVLMDDWEVGFGEAPLGINCLCYVPPEIIWQYVYACIGVHLIISGRSNVYQFSMLCCEFLSCSLPLHMVSVRYIETDNRGRNGSSQMHLQGVAMQSLSKGVGIVTQQTGHHGRIVS